MENLLATVQQVRATFGPTMTDDECARLCNEVAWRHRTTGWGLSRKTSGTRGRLPNGVEVAHDILHHQPTNTLVDILTAAGAASAPVWQHVGPPMSPDRAWLAPVDPATWAPAPAGPSEAELLLAELRALAAEVAALKQAVQASVRVEAAIDRGLPLRLKSIVGTLVGTVGGPR